MESEPKSLKIVLPGERPVSLNDWSDHHHWAWRDALKQRHLLTVSAALAGMEYTPFTSPVSITITAYFDTRPLDPDNIFGKYYIDALKHYTQVKVAGKFTKVENAHWVIEEDTPACITSVTFQSRTDKDNPRVELDIIPVYEQETKSH